MYVRFERLLARVGRSTRIGGAVQGLTRDQECELRALRIRAIASLAPVMMAANLLNVAVVDCLFWGTSHKRFLVVWSLAVLVSVAVWGENWRRAKAFGDRDRASVRGVRRVMLHALLFGAIWAAPMIAMFPDGGEARRVVLATCAAGMIGGGALALATVWRAALVYALTIGIPTAIVLTGADDPMYLGLVALAASFGAVIARIVLERDRALVGGFRANLSLCEQVQVIELLLKEYEEHSSDWLFEVDARARLVRVSPRLAKIVGKPAEELNGMSVATLLGGSRVEGNAHPDSATAALKRAFRRRLPFRDILLPMRIGGEERWLSLAAKPTFDADGRFSGYRGFGSDITDAKRAEASIERMASYDALTGLPNRNLLHSRLTRALERFQQDGAKFAVLSLDLDRFKTVNDTLGHQIGDLVLIEAARRIADELPDQDIVARVGGDEFVILQFDARQPADAGGLAERLIAAVGAPYEINSQRILVGASVGVALVPGNGENADDILRNSDLALYRAKADGKGRFRYFVAEMDAIVRSRRILEIDLREALEKGELEVFFQPLIEISTGQISACEALVRWNHKTRGYISPVDFIPLAEETGLIVPLGEFVLRKACAEAASWTRDLRIAVNLSVVQFRSGDLADIVASVLSESGLDARRLELEITESILIDERDGVLKTLQSLRALGVRISLDDFGTGYSSLAYLSSFPFDKIKIDRSFVRDVAARPDSAAIIRAITGLATTLGIRTTAEGVENIEELDWLRDQGCGEVQGFLFSAPVPSQDLKLLLGMTSASRVKRGVTRGLVA